MLGWKQTTFFFLKMLLYFHMVSIVSFQNTVVSLSVFSLSYLCFIVLLLQLYSDASRCDFFKILFEIHDVSWICGLMFSLVGKSSAINILSLIIYAPFSLFFFEYSWFLVHYTFSHCPLCFLSSVLNSWFFLSLLFTLDIFFYFLTLIDSSVVPNMLLLLLIS